MALEGRRTVKATAGELAEIYYTANDSVEINGTKARWRHLQPAERAYATERMQRFLDAAGLAFVQAEQIIPDRKEAS
jgi:hypothetical protein